MKKKKGWGNGPAFRRAKRQGDCAISGGNSRKGTSGRINKTGVCSVD